MTVEESVCNVLVRRLFEELEDEWFVGSHFENETLESIQKWQPVEKYMHEEDRHSCFFRSDETKEYDLGRVRYFVDRLMRGEDLDPIELDNDCGHQCIYPQPIVVDGYHRLVAYRLAGRETIPVTYGGRLDVLSYLIGKRKHMPTSIVRM